MNKNIEKEYKILVTQEQFTKLLEDYPNAVFQKQVNTYYDTKAFTIQKAYGAMRIREVNKRFLFTLKQHTHEGLMEHELYVKENNVSVFQNEEIKALLASLDIHDSIIPITTLTTYRAMIDTGVAELCFDYNEYGSIKDYEIEYEYKKPHDGRTIFNQILSKVNLYYEKNCTSKIQRALDQI